MPEERGYRDKSHLDPQKLSNEMIIQELKQLASTPVGAMFGPDENFYCAELTEEILNFRGAEGKALYIEAATELTESAKQADNAWFLLSIIQQDIPHRYRGIASLTYSGTINAEHNRKMLDHYSERCYAELEKNVFMPSKDLSTEERFQTMRQQLADQLADAHDISMGRVSQLAYRYLRYGNLLYGEREMHHDWLQLCEDRVQDKSSIGLRILSHSVAAPGQRYEPKEVWDTLLKELNELEENFKTIYVNKEARFYAERDGAGLDGLASDRRFTEKALKSVVSRSEKKALLNNTDEPPSSGENDKDWRTRIEEAQQKLRDGGISGPKSK